MNKKSLEEFTLKYVQPLFHDSDLEIYDQEYVKEDGRNILRFYIDRDEGSIGINDCEFASMKISDVLDEIDPIEESYYLEVASPGIDRPLKKEKDFIKSLGKEVDIKFYGSYSGLKEIRGVLKDFNSDSITISYEGKVEIIERSKIATIRLAI